MWHDLEDALIYMMFSGILKTFLEWMSSFQGITKVFVLGAHPYARFTSKWEHLESRFQYQHSQIVLSVHESVCEVRLKVVRSYRMLNLITCHVSLRIGYQSLPG